MQLHSNATTNLKQRQLFQESPDTCRSLAQMCCVSPSTVSKWKRRSSPDELSCRPNTIHYAFGHEEETFILSLRNKRLTLDELVDAVAVVLPGAKRATVHRVLQRHNVSRLKDLEKQEAEPDGKFKDYEPGYLHIDCFYLPKIDGSRKYCFVAIDRATRLVYLRVYDNIDQESAVNFLGRCLSFYPFMIKKILTDNGREFTLANWARWGKRIKNTHAFDQVCQACGIEHRLTRPYTPKTNGLVERTNGLIRQDTHKRHKYPGYPELIDALHAWLAYYNLRRKHRRIGRKTPYEAVCDWYRKCPNLFIKEPTHLPDSLSTIR